jgi:preprotein translocase subunit SecB
LEFVLAGFFSCTEEIVDFDLSDFARQYTLSILWPYAREYASDVFKRSGFPFPELPIINPQSVTDDLLRKGLVTTSGMGISIKDAK